MLVTLTTDFGLRDGYVAAMKGAMLRVEPALRLMDVSHMIAAQDVMEGAFVLRQVVPYTPPGTVHLAVVDPGVGSARQGIAARFGDQFFVGPDNGLLALLLDGGAPDEAVVLDRPAFWRTSAPSATFHGRDVFGPVAAHLARGARLDALGAPAEPAERLLWPLPRADWQGIEGWVAHVDGYGNCITNIPRALVERYRGGRRVKGFVGSTIVRDVHRTYSDVPAGEPVMLYGSGDVLEVSVNEGNAARLLSVRRGNPVTLVFEGPPPTSAS
ncbi:MAG: S-adenosyl-l-methionine hydroxide adenosyltransferase family protein [Rubricoccaceae bacterium]